MDILERYKRARLFVKACEIAQAEQDVTDEYQKATREYNELAQRVEALISQIDDPSERLLLKLRYVQGLPWGQVFNRLEDAGLIYCDRQLYRKHRKAKEKVRKLDAQESTRTD